MLKKHGGPSLSVPKRRFKNFLQCFPVFIRWFGTCCYYFHQIKPLKFKRVALSYIVTLVTRMSKLNSAQDSCSAKVWSFLLSSSVFSKTWVSGTLLYPGELCLVSFICFWFGAVCDQLKKTQRASQVLVRLEHLTSCLE